MIPLPGKLAIIKLVRLDVLPVYSGSEPFRFEARLKDGESVKTWSSLFISINICSIKITFSVYVFSLVKSGNEV